VLYRCCIAVLLQITQMKFRLSEGSGECFYYLGVEDDGYPRGLDTQELQESMAVIHRMAVSLQVSLQQQHEAAAGARQFQAAETCYTEQRLALCVAAHSSIGRQHRQQVRQMLPCSNICQ
jgi:GTPase